MLDFTGTFEEQAGKWIITGNDGDEVSVPRERLLQLVVTWALHGGIGEEELRGLGRLAEASNQRELLAEAEGLLEGSRLRSRGPSFLS